MKILLLGLNFFPEITGIGRYTGEMTAFLASQGHQVRVITSPPYYPQWRVWEGYRASAYQQEYWQGVAVLRCPLWVPLRQSGIKRVIHLASFAISSLPVLAAQLGWKPDLIFCVAPALFNSPFALLAARLTGAKAWLHIQDFELDAALGLGLLPAAGWLRSLAAAIEKKLLSGFDRVSTISENMRRSCLKKGVLEDKTSLLPNWVDVSKIFPIRDAYTLRLEFGLPQNAFIALYHGSMGRKQGLEILLETARLLAEQPDVLIVLCGEGPAKSDLQTQAADLSNVRFLDLQPEEKLNQLVNLADVHLLPQLPGAADLVMPSKLATMLASGRPIIATASAETQISNVLDIIGIRVPPGDAVSLSAAILDLVTDPLRRAKLGELSRAWACENLHKEKILSRFHDALLSIL